MKNSVFLRIALTCVLIFVLLTLSSCGECTEHTFDNGCDTSCNNEGCDFIRETQHVYDHGCDPDCNECGKLRGVSHVFDNDCDGDCSVPGCGATRPTEHKFDHGCDGECNVCGQARETKHIYAHDCDKECKVTGCGYVRETQHVFDNDCDESCNTARCGYVRETEHKYDSACDGECNVCGFDRTVDHVFDNVCDTVCNVEGCGYEREASHLFDHECDSECNTEGCGYTRETQHVYDHDCDKKCNVEGCGYVRETEHKYDNACDGICNVVGCGATRPIEHKYDHACDGDCNECGYERTVNHLYSHDCDSICNTEECKYERSISHAFAHGLDKVCDNTQCGYTREIKMQSVLLVGQSNMSGRGDISTVAPISDDRIHLLKEGSWTKMQEPIHYDAQRGGVCLAASFAKAFVETFDVDLGLVPAAVGGTSLEMWAVGGDLYNEAIKRAKKAQESSEICAILWHQGESDQSNPNYAALLRVIFDSMIEDLGLEKDKIVIVTGELFGTRSDKVHKAQLEKLSEYYPKYGIAESDGLTVFDVTTHFDAQSLRVFGYRYFDIFYNRTTGGRYEFIDDPNHYYIPPAEDENDGSIASYDFNNLTTGQAKSVSNKVSFSPQTGQINIVELTSNEKYLSIKTGYDSATGKYSSSYFDIFNSAAEDSVVVIEAKFKRNGVLGAPADLIKVIGAIDKTQTTYRTVRVDKDGKLYNFTAGDKVVGEYLGYDLDEWEWTPIKVVLDLKNNLKTIYINDEKIVENLPITRDSVEGYSLTKTRVVQYIADSAESEILVDDYKCYLSTSEGDVESGTDYICNEGFESLTSGKKYTETTTFSKEGIKFSTLSESSYITVVNGESGNCLMMTRGSDKLNTFVDLQHSIDAGSKFVIEGKFRRDEGSTVAADLLKLTPKSGSFNLVYLSTDGKLCNYVYANGKGSVGQAIGVISTTEWTHIKVVVDLENNTKDIYINGALVLSGAQVYDTSVTDTALTKSRPVHTKDGEGTLYFDDVCYYYYSE